MDGSKCRKCGRCCARKIVVEDKVFYTEYYCPYLDRETKLCTVYDRRHEINPHCLTVEEGIKVGVFPADCPFVAHIPDYAPPAEKWDEHALEEALEVLAQAEDE